MIFNPHSLQTRSPICRVVRHSASGSLLGGQGSWIRRQNTSRRLGTLMKLAASHQAAGDVCRLQRRAFGRRMGGEIAGDRNEDVPALVGVAPNGELPDSASSIW